MNMCIQTTIELMDEDLNKAVVSLRLSGAEAVRYWRLVHNAQAKNPYVGKTDVIRELIGLDPLNILTEEDLKFFHGQALGESLAPHSARKMPEASDQAPKRASK